MKSKQNEKKKKIEKQMDEKPTRKLKIIFHCLEKV